MDRGARVPEMMLREILDSEDQYDLMTKLLKKQGFYVQRVFFNRKPALKLPFGKPFGGAHGRVQLKDGKWWFDVKGGRGNWHGDGNESDVINFFTTWIHQNLNEDHSPSLKETKEFGRNEHGYVISAPLIWRAVKYATEVEKKDVWSNIPRAEGTWTIRYGAKENKNTPLADMRYFYIRYQNDYGEDDWFEIIPEDDDCLELHPDGGGGYEVRDPEGKFKV